jgi:hypothetical protein
MVSGQSKEKLNSRKEKEKTMEGTVFVAGGDMARECQLTM